jgi:hypothetical protein
MSHEGEDEMGRCIYIMTSYILCPCICDLPLHFRSVYVIHIYDTCIHIQICDTSSTGVLRYHIHTLTNT